MRRNAGFELGKKTQATSKQDKEVAAARYRAVINARRLDK